MKTGNWAILLAAGAGVRTGLSYNKVFYRLDGRTVLSRCLDAICQGNHFDGLVIALSEGDYPRFESVLAEEGKPLLPYKTVIGGKTRMESAANALKAIPDDAEIIAIHDAARCFVTENIIKATIESARQYGSGIAATKLIDTVKRVNDHDFASETPDRSHMRAVQTPQVFQKSIITTAYEKAMQLRLSVTDDASVVEQTIGPVRLVVTDDGYKNRKITVPEDLVLNDTYSVPQTGIGFDAHKLVEGRKLILGGVEIPYEKGLLGHSDADVLVHAIIDALLGAANLGDIGALFPDSSMEYKDISSVVLLERTEKHLRENGFSVAHVDATLLAQAPKIRPFIASMQKNIATALTVPVEHVSVKATTTEKMGYEGRGEGMSAMACATVIYMKKWRN